MLRKQAHIFAHTHKDIRVQQKKETIYRFKRKQHIQNHAQIYFSSLIVMNKFGVKIYYYNIFLYKMN